MDQRHPLALWVLLVLTLLAGSPPAGDAQREFIGNTLSISVQVKDQAGNPLRGASQVRLEKEDGGLIQESTTDPEGRVRFNDIPRESLVVVVHREGYVPARERLGMRQTLREIFLPISLAKSAALGEKTEEQMRVGTDELAMPPKARRNHAKGLGLAKKGDYERAALYLEKATQLYPTSPTLWNDLGSNYLRLQKYDLAEKALRRALETDKNALFPLLNLGMLYNLENRFTEAEDLLDQFTKREGHRWQAFLELGNAHLGLREFSKAENDYKRAIELNPQPPPEIHVKLATVYVAGREFSHALKEYETYLQQEPNGALASRVREVVERMKADGGIFRSPE